MKYAKATLWIFYAWAMRKLRLPTRWLHGVEDQATMRMFDCALDFQPVGRTASPPGWTCPHGTITSGDSLVSASCGMGCTMQPISMTRAST